MSTKAEKRKQNSRVVAVVSAYPRDDLTGITQISQATPDVYYSVAASIMADLMHVAERKGLDPYAVLDMAHTHYSEERGD